MAILGNQARKENPVRKVLPVLLVRRASASQVCRALLARLVILVPRARMANPAQLGLQEKMAYPASQVFMEILARMVSQAQPVLKVFRGLLAPKVQLGRLVHQDLLGRLALQGARVSEADLGMMALPEQQGTQVKQDRPVLQARTESLVPRATLASPARQGLQGPREMTESPECLARLGKMGSLVQLVRMVLQASLARMVLLVQLGRPARMASLAQLEARGHPEIPVPLVLPVSQGHLAPREQQVRPAQKVYRVVRASPVRQARRVYLVLRASPAQQEMMASPDNLVRWVHLARMERTAQRVLVVYPVWLESPVWLGHLVQPASLVLAFLENPDHLVRLVWTALQARSGPVAPRVSGAGPGGTVPPGPMDTRAILVLLAKMASLAKMVPWELQASRARMAPMGPRAP